jgi:hypothetical protein
MLAFDVTMTIWWLLFLALLSAILGFFVRSRNISSLKRKLSELENEMLRSHADILELQKQNNELERKLNESQSPVIPMKAPKEEKGSQPFKKQR